MTEYLTDEQRRQVGEARSVLASWDRKRHGGAVIFDRERVLADQVRALLGLLDQVAPEGGTDA